MPRKHPYAGDRGPLPYRRDLGEVAVGHVKK
jgi:hypothetical protein